MSILDQNTPQSYIPYLATGTGVFSASGSPEGIQNGGIGSIYTDLTTGDLYTKTTAYALNTGWVLVGGGGSGTVTSVGLTVPSALFDSPVAGTPITTSGTFAVALASQTANKVFASPNGSAGLPTFRALTSTDLGAAAAPPNFGIQYNDGTNAFTASNGFRVDPATNTLQVGELNVLKGTIQLQAGSGGGSFKITTNVPSTNHVWILPDAAPTLDQLLKVSAVSGANYTLGYISPSALGFASVNPTSGVLPYNNAGAFSDSPLSRVSSTAVLLSGTTSNTIPGIQVNSSAQGFGLGSNNDLVEIFSGTPRAALNASAKVLYNVGLALTTGAYGSNSMAGIIAMASGVLRVATTNGGSALGTGAARLVVGSSTAATTNQFLVDSQSTTTIAGFFSMPGSSSVATIKAETSAIQSFAFYPTGKLQGGCNIPTSNQQFSAIGNLKSDVSEVGNVGTGLDNLLSFAVPASSVANTGNTVEFKTTVVFASNANNKKVEITFGGVSVFLVSDLFGNAGASQAEITVRIKRTGATTAKVIATWISSDTLLRADCQYTDAAAITWSSANTLQVKGEATTTDDIINKELESNVIIAQTS